jgi:hypothetical protein
MAKGGSYSTLFILFELFYRLLLNDTNEKCLFACLILCFNATIF